MYDDNHRQMVPRHVGLICDGNGRWATQRNLPRAVGHLEGARRLVDLIRSLIKERQKQQHQDQKAPRRSSKPDSASANANAVGCLTLYAFSTENWNRSPSEIAKIFEAIEFAATAIRNLGDLADVDLKVLGDLSDDRIPASLRKVLHQLEERTRQRRNLNKQKHHDFDHDRLLVCLAVNYGGRRDIVSACRSLAQAVQDGSLDASNITEDSLQSRLATGGMPPPDLIVRTGGEHRLSNFLLWEAAYAELFVSQVLWPDFSWEGEWKHSLDWYSKRKRNFGGREEQ
jgi:undecaprenyl diphosphate synthase